MRPLKRFFLYLICYCIYPFSFLFIRKKNKYAFGSFRGAFNDNAKYLFIYCQRFCPTVNSAWLSINKETVNHIKQLGLKSYYIFSPKGIFFALTSKFWIYNSYVSDIMFCLSGNAVCINLWHGITLKRIEYSINSGPLKERYQKKSLKEVFYHPESFRKPDFLLSTSPFQTAAFTQAFRIKEEQCWELGYPRNYLLTCSDQSRENFIKCYELNKVGSIVNNINGKYKKVFGYFPTWRDSQRELFSQELDLNRLNSIMQKEDSLLILKPHANTEVNIEDIDNYSNVIFLDSKIDVNVILPFVNVLITDYSSILYDFIIMKDRGVILYVYDYNNYVKERDFTFPFDENVVGKKVYDFESLCLSLEHDDYSIDENKRNEIVEKFWGETLNSNPCEEIVRRISSLS